MGYLQEKERYYFVYRQLCYQVTDNKNKTEYIIMKQRDNNHRLLLTCIMVISIILLSMLGYHFINNLNKQTRQQTDRLKVSRLLDTTNTTRLDIITTYCPGGTTLSITDSDRTKNQMYQSQLASYFKANSTRLILDILKFNLQDFMVEIQVNGVGTIIFISPFIIGFIVLLSIWPFLLCCCICQDDCPVKCCRDKNPRYSNSQLNWPTAVIIILCLLIISVCIPALTNAKSYFNNVTCQISKFLDDFYNGNATADGQYFFAGITTIRSQLTSVLSPNLAGIQTQINRLTGSAGSQLSYEDANATILKNSMQNMPNGANSGYFTLTYNYPIQSSTSTGTLNSIVGSHIGIYTNSSTSLGSFYNLIDTIQTNMTNIKNAAVDVSPHLTPAIMGSSITVTDGILASLQNNLDSIQPTIKSALQFLAMLDSYNTTYTMALYSAILGLSILILIGIIFVKCLNIIGCRHFLYFLCLISFFFCIIIFLFAIALSIIIPSLYYTCDYIGNSFQSPTSFYAIFQNIGDPNYMNISSSFQQCFGGTYDFMTAMNPSLKGDINNLQIAVTNTATYDFVGMQNNISSQLTAIQNLINEYGLGQAPDFDITSALGAAEINYFNQVDNKSLYTASCPTSAFSVFYTDVWVPSISSTYQNYVSCGNIVGIDSSTCPNGLTPSCPTSRCLDTFSILNAYYQAGTTANIPTDSNNRYGTCTNFDNYLTNFLNNYVIPVSSNIGNTVDDSSDSSKLAGRFSSINSLAQTYNTQMTGSVQTLFTQVYGNLTSTVNVQSVIDPTTGVFVGLDCRLLSEDAGKVKDSLCISTLNTIFFTLVTVGIMAFSMLVLVCCILCFNVRHYQQSISLVRVIPLDDSTSSIKHF